MKIFIFLALACAGFFCVQKAIAQELININTDTLEELDTLPGIGSSKAQAIIDYRDANGPFQAIEEITNVSGIGSVTFENIKDMISVGGAQDDIVNDGEDVDEQEGLTPAPSPSTGEGNYKTSDVVINEFISDPADGEVEWIELYNTTGKPIDLTGWSIEEGSESKTKLEGEIDKFFIIEKPKGNLNNKGDIIILRDAFNNLIDKVAYGDWDDGNIDDNAPVAGDPKSTARLIDGQNSNNNKNDFVETTEPTKGGGNVIVDDAEEENKGGSVSIVISEILPNPFGIDANGEFIELYNNSEEDVDLFGWRLENKIKNKYEFKEEKIIGPGEYLVIYRIESNLVLNNKSDSVKLFKPDGVRASQSVKFKNAEEGHSYNYSVNGWLWSGKITPGKENILPEINILPKAELYYPKEALVGVPIIFDASDTVDEDGDSLTFSWDFGDGFKNNLQNPAHTFLEEGSYNISLAVNDGKEDVKKSVTIKIVGDLKESSDEQLSWVNVLKLDDENLFNDVDGHIEIPENYYSASSDMIITPIMATIEEVKNLNAGDFVLINGVVSVLPGILGSQYFYIVEGGSGIQVYSYKKDFPELEVGDYVEIVGELSQAAGEMRIKISQKENIIILSHGEDPIAQSVASEKVDDDLVGSLIKITGEIVERKSSTIYLDDGMGEVKVYLKTSTRINPKNYEEGETVEITGILGRTKTGLRIMPRSPDDIIKKEVESEEEENGMVLGEVAESDEWTIEARDKKMELFKYLLVIAGGAIVLLGGLLIKSLKKG